MFKRNTVQKEYSELAWISAEQRSVSNKFAAGLSVQGSIVNHLDQHQSRKILDQCISTSF